MKVLVYTAFPGHAELYRQLTAAAPEAEFRFFLDAVPSKADVADVDVIIGNVPGVLLLYAKKLKWFQLNSAGADMYCKPGLLPEGVVLTNATGAYGTSIAEHMVAMVLTLFRDFHVYSRQQTAHYWKPHGTTRMILGSTTLCVGLGDIGTNFCRRMHALGSYTVGVKRRPSEKPEGVDELWLTDHLDELLPRADIVALSLPGTSQTNHILTRERLRKCKKDAIVLNVGRGSCIDTEALIEALQEGEIGGAALDVLEKEPLPADSPLWDMENVFITPHTAGGCNLRLAVENIVAIASRNLIAYQKGEPLENVVDPAIGYKK